MKKYRATVDTIICGNPVRKNDEVIGLRDDVARSYERAGLIFPEAEPVKTPKAGKKTAK